MATNSVLNRVVNVTASIAAPVPASRFGGMLILTIGTGPHITGDSNYRPVASENEAIFAQATGPQKRAVRYSSLEAAVTDGFESGSAYDAIAQYFSTSGRQSVLVGTLDRQKDGKVRETLGAGARATAAAEATITEPEDVAAALTEIARIDANFWAVCLTQEFNARGNGNLPTLSAIDGRHVDPADGNSADVTQQNLSFDDIEEIRKWCSGSGRHLFVQSSELNAYAQTKEADNAKTGTLVARMNQKADASVMVVPTPGQYGALEYAAIFSNVNYNIAGSAPDGMFLRLRNITPHTLTPDEMQNLDDKNCNYYANMGPYAITATGVTTDGYWLDDIHFAGWLRYRVQRALINYRIRSGRLFQSDADVARLHRAAARVCDIGALAGSIGPGTWSDEAARQIAQVTGGAPGRTATGYLIYSPPIDTLSAADFSRRKIPPIYVWGHRSGAVHSMDVAIMLVD